MIIQIIITSTEGCNTEEFEYSLKVCKRKIVDSMVEIDFWLYPSMLPASIDLPAK